MNFTDLAKSYVRTVVPAIVGAIVAWALHHGHDVHGYLPQITAVVTAGYYAVARLLEHYVSPRFGWLLGVAATPLYGSQVRTLKVSGPSSSVHTVKMEMDTTQVHAALDKVKAHAREVAAAVDATKPQHAQAVDAAVRSAVKRTSRRKA